MAQFIALEPDRRWEALGTGLVQGGFQGYEAAKARQRAVGGAYGDMLRGMSERDRATFFEQSPDLANRVFETNPEYFAQQRTEVPDDVRNLWGLINNDKVERGEFIAPPNTPEQSLWDQAGQYREALQGRTGDAVEDINLQNISRAFGGIRGRSMDNLAGLSRGQLFNLLQQVPFFDKDISGAGGGKTTRNYNQEEVIKYMLKAREAYAYDGAPEHLEMMRNLYPLLDETAQARFAALLDPSMMAELTPEGTAFARARTQQAGIGKGRRRRPLAGIPEEEEEEEQGFMGRKWDELRTLFGVGND
jgi:hypothetical protein